MPRTAGPMGQSAGEHPREDRRPGRRRRPRRVPPLRPGPRAVAPTSCSRTRRSSRATRPAATGSPRARSGSLQRLGLEDWLRAHTVNQGLRAHGFGQTLLLPWPGGSLPDWGSAVARTELDDHLRTTALKSGATGVDGARAVDVRRDGERVAAVVFKTATGTVEIACDTLVVADGVRSPLGKVLGREWHRDTVYGVAGRSYVASETQRRPVDQLAPRACAVPTATSSAATAGSSRWAPAR